MILPLAPRAEESSRALLEPRRGYDTPGPSVEAVGRDSGAEVLPRAHRPAVDAPVLETPHTAGPPSPRRRTL